MNQKEKESFITNEYRIILIESLLLLIGFASIYLLGEVIK